MRPSRKSVVAAAVLAGLGILIAAGRPGVVRTRDGGRYDGIVDERDDTVVVNVRGIESTIPRARIDKIEYGDFEQRWTDDYKKLGAKDIDGRLKAGQRAIEEKRFDLAEKAARDAQAIDPNSAAADQLLRVAMSQRRYDKAGTDNGGTNNGAAAGGGTESVPGGNTVGPNGTVKPFGTWTTLAPDDVNRVKQIELRDNDTKVRFSFANNVRKKFYEASPRLASKYPTYGDFLRETQLSQALAVLDEGRSDFAKDVKVANDPETLVSFRSSVLPLVLQGCATSVCHGGNDNAATKAFALAGPANEPAVVYTDFYVLGAYKQALKGAPGGGPSMSGNTQMATTGNMIDRTRPEMSLVLQYGLPEGAADIKHPHVRGYNGIFRGRDDTKYQQVLAWIGTLRPVQPNYDIDFQLRRREPGEPATQPTR